MFSSILMPMSLATVYVNIDYKLDLKILKSISLFG